MSYFNRKAVPQATQDEITRRAASSEWITNGRTPYVQITSMCDKCDPNYQLNLNASINPATADQDQSNAVGEAFLKSKNGGQIIATTPVTPTTSNRGNYAQVKNLTVVKQGELGTSRKATVQIYCKTDDELLELQKCYFIPGMSVRIQWGWSGYNGPAIAQLTTLPTKMLDSDALTQMNSNTSKYANNEGMQGPVSNFSYKWNEKDKYWDCTVEVLSAAVPANGSLMKPDCIPTKICYANISSTGADGSDKKATITLDAIELALQTEAAKGVNLSTWQMVGVGAGAILGGAAIAAVALAVAGVGGLVLAIGGGAAYLLDDEDDTARKEEERWTSVFQYEGDTRDPLDFGKADGGFWSDTMGTGTNEAYISLGKLTDIINNVLYGVSSNTDNYSANIASTFATNFKKACNFDGNTLESFKDLGCSDARICFIPGTNYLDELLDDYSPTQVPSAINGEGKVIVNNIALNAIHALKVYREMRVAAKEDPENTEHLVNSSEYLNRILNDINVSCGNPWKNLRVEYSETAGTNILMENKSTGAGAPVPAFNIPVGGLTYVIDSLDLQLKMSGAMKTQAVYGNNNPKGAGLLCSEPTFQAFGLSSGYFNNMGKEPRSEPVPCKPEEEEATGNCKDEPPTTQELFEEAGNGHSDSDCTNLADRLSAIYEQTVGLDGKLLEPNPDDALAACKNIPLPFEMSFQMDGIGGFGFGQVITCNFIPPAVRDNFEFQILTVEHKVSAQKWSIDVKTVARTNPKTTT